MPWPDAGHLTLSFVPDGTRVGNQQSQLFSLLDASAPTQVWQRQILRAFQKWAAPTNINIVPVSDGGDPLGTTGPVQGDSRFGDIRIAAVPLPSDAVAFAIPFDPKAGSWAGDIEFNSNYLFNVGGTSGYDLFSVALHEAGHALSLDGSSDPNSPMFDSFAGIRASLTAGDISAIQSLYGVRTLDAFDAAHDNGSLTTATPVNLVNLSGAGNGVGPTVLDAKLSSLADVDFYSFKPGNNQSGFTIVLQTTGISSLMPSLTIYSPGQSVMTEVTASDPFHGDLTIHLTNLTVGATYYVKVAGAASDDFSVGSYRLQMVPDAATPASGIPSTTPVLPANDFHTNDTAATATDIRNTLNQNNASYAYALRAGISDGNDIDFYHLRSPQGQTGTTTVMRVLAWGIDVGGLDPVVSVFDSQARPVAFTVLVNENGSDVIQVTNALPNSDYYVAVQAEQPNGPHNVGNYFLGVQFSTVAVNLQTLTSGTLDQSTPQATLGTLQVNQSQLFHLALSATSDQKSAAVTMTIYDQAGNKVSTLTALTGQTQTITLFLTPGTYTIQVAGQTTDGSPLQAISFSLFGIGLSDPMGPQPTNPTLSPTPLAPELLLDRLFLKFKSWKVAPRPIIPSPARQFSSLKYLLLQLTIGVPQSTLHLRLGCHSRTIRFAPLEVFLGGSAGGFDFCLLSRLPKQNVSVPSAAGLVP